MHSRQTHSGSMSDTLHILEAALAILQQGEQFLKWIAQDSYRQTVPQAFGACIGEHYRHCLDHFTQLLQGREAGVIDYDSRVRDPRISSQPEAALELSNRLREQLGGMVPSQLESRIRVRCKTSYQEGDSPVSESTVARELVYLINHAIHHFALISVMCRIMGLSVPQPFGVAPSTVAYQRGSESR